MGRVVRFGFWGTGTVARDVALDFSLLPNAELRAVASRTPGNARIFAARFGIPRSYDGLDALLDDSDVDVIYVSTPHHCHADDSLRCIDAGKGVLCEKPFALNAVEGERVVAAARARKVFVMEAMWMRFIPAIVETKRRVQAGELGRIRFMQANFAYPVRHDSQHRLFSPRHGGGALLDRGVYPVSLACHLLGVPQSIHGCATFGESGVDEQSSYQLVCPDGAIADLSASLRVLGTNEAVVMGELGQIRLHAPFYRAHRLSVQRVALPQVSSPDTHTPSNLVHRLKNALKRSPAMHRLRRQLDPLRAAVDAVRSRTLAFPGNGYQFEVAEVVRCVQEGRTESTVMPLDDSLAVLRILDELRSQWK